jgi:hypothetical protein
MEALIESTNLKKSVSPNIVFGREPKHPLDEIINRIIAKIPGIAPAYRRQRRR